MNASCSTLETEETITVPLGPREYCIRVGTGGMPQFGIRAREALDARWGGRACSSALVVADANVEFWSVRYGDALRASGIEPVRALVPAGEASKSLARASALWDRLAAMSADRHTLVVAVGGGVVGDLAGFVAATFARGLPLLMAPTTLLAQVDSSVGGKVGINHSAAKNMIGAFHQPIGVWIDTDTLATLSNRALRCGLAEVVKYGVIYDSVFFDRIERELDAILSRDPAALRQVIGRCCQIKAEVVGRDEREESGARAILNFGHTVGHAIEAVAGYGGTHEHGEAVAIGMVAECRLAEIIGFAERGLSERVRRLLERIGLPTSARQLPVDALIEAMRFDKKNERGRIRFVLPRGIGSVDLTELPSRDDLREVLAT